MNCIPHKQIQLLIILIISFFSAIATPAAPAISPVPQTGQSTCYDPTENTTIVCKKSGQDGDTLSGIAWPNPRFVDNGNQSITDKLTGLIWVKDANPSREYKTWQQALDYIKALNTQNYLGHNDWRLPNLKEMESMVIKKPNPTGKLIAQGFSNVMPDHYWTSTTYASYANYAWSVNMSSGLLASHGKVESGYVWPVRNGELGALLTAKTGQTACYDNFGANIECAATGQDGELQKGAPWPNPRFTNNSDETITDRLTGLVWSKGAKAPGPVACNPGVTKTWEQALNFVTCLNTNSYLGKSDWRLPNRNEIASLVNYGQPNIALWLNRQGFNNVQAYSYYSSSTYADVAWNAWSVSMYDGAVTSNAKMRAINVWPVRSGI